MINIRKCIDASAHKRRRAMFFRMLCVDYQTINREEYK